PPPRSHTLPLHDALPIYQGGMTIIEHLEELRTRIIRMLIAFCVAAVVAWFLYNPILGFLILPLRHLPQAARVIKGNGALIVTSPDRKSTRLNSSHQIISY